MSDAKRFFQETLDILRELDTNESYKEELLSRSRRLYKDYQKGKYGYLQYQHKLKELLHDKTEEEWIESYDSYAYSLLKRVEYLLEQCFYLIHKDESYNELKIQSPEIALAKTETVLEKIASLNPFKHKKVFDLDTEIEKLASKPIIQSMLHPKAKTETEKRIELLKERLKKRQNKEVKARIKLPGIIGIILSFISTLISRILSYASIQKIKAVIKLPKRKIIVSNAEAKITPLPKIPLAEKPKQSIMDQLISLFSPKKRTIFVEEIVEMEKLQKAEVKKKAEPEGAVLGWASGVNLVKEALSREIMSRFSKKQENVIGETTIPGHIKKLREMREKLYVEERMTGFETTLLAQEAKRVKKIIEAQKMQEYKGLSIGIIANVTVKKISLYLVNKFPTFFGFLYNALRSANIRMLSNTYVNIMILSTIFITLVTAIGLVPVFFILNYPLYQTLLRAIIFSGIAGGLTATIFYAYPFIRIKERRRSTTTNLPFAVNHMASVATSGVPPAIMFELISTSTEYGEVAVEIKKIVDFTKILGYDLLTAIRAVASTTPSPVFKEFLEGMVSTIETGGDLVSYLKQKGDEANLTYQLEREKYNQNISTFSDIYTGLLIAAPLFFVAALALVNMLGGKIGGMGVDLVMALGAYIAIPLLNIAFLLFLQISQPDV